MNDDLDTFVQLLSALTRTPEPPAPRGPSEHLLHAALAVFNAWRTRRVRPPAEAVPLGEHIELRQKLREAVAERDRAVAELNSMRTPTLQPSPRSAVRRPHNNPRNRQ